MQKFKQAAYEMVRSRPPLVTYFEEKPPYIILVAYRRGGPNQRVTRFIINLHELIAALKKQFPSPEYEIHLLNTADLKLDFRMQIEAVARAHIVITNHGAFEANMIYMRNGSLLLELFGRYGNNEVHTFHRLALTFGLYYSRLNPVNMIDHQLQNFTLAPEDIDEVLEVTKEYFDKRGYRVNLKPAQ